MNLVNSNVRLISLTMTYLLVDVCYLFFYRYHATKLWYKRAHDYTDDLAMASDPKFAQTYQKKIKDCIQDLIKKHKSSWDKVILCRDGRKKYVWRNQLASDYKANRDTSALTGLAKAAYLLRLSIFDLVRYQNAKSIGVFSAEADDIVYASMLVIRERDPQAKIIIVASDQDYYQILTENTLLVGLDKRDHMKNSSRFTHDLPPDQARQIDLLVKIISGDPADNIKAISAKCGKKTAIRLALNPSELENWFQKHPGSQTQFLANQKMIDMSQIPESLLENMKSRVRRCLNV